MGAEDGVAVAFEDEVAAGVEARVRFAVGVAVGVAVGIGVGVKDHGFTSSPFFVCSMFWLIRSYAFFCLIPTAGSLTEDQFTCLHPHRPRRPSLALSALRFERT